MTTPQVEVIRRSARQAVRAVPILSNYLLTTPTPKDVGFTGSLQRVPVSQATTSGSRTFGFTSPPQAFDSYESRSRKTSGTVLFAVKQVVRFAHNHNFTTTTFHLPHKCGSLHRRF